MIYCLNKLKISFYNDKILPYLLSEVKVERVDSVALSKLGSTSAQDQNECIAVIKVSPF